MENKKQIRTKHTWGGSCWSFDYFITAEEASASIPGRVWKYDYTPYGQQYKKYAIRSVIQRRTKGVWKTI